ncbi:unnamed protein product [Adineta steineri]|uniref:DUF4291 domain-containing protein n=1 Tax=Adineta steineri TaxID=433720 RepID=A0A814G0J7_9BILA|nr:unnamed protein product [Adineta steineri]CAF0989630.1 unnamed protein product [Adineta steineri]
MNTELYIDAQRRWPSRRCRPGGKWILASFDDESVIVHQAYNHDIAKYACENGCFTGCPTYNEQRMTWIKTSFLWMMYRSNWASRSNQQHILAIWLRRSAFDNYLARSVNSDIDDLPSDPSIRLKGRVRLQWDPDHEPHGEPTLGRRAIQLGLRQIDSFLDGRDILRIVDISSFVRNQYTNAVLPKRRRGRDQLDQLRIPIVNIYEPDDEQIRRHIQLDSIDITETR